MKHNIFFIILLLSINMGFSQIERTIVSSSGFTNPEYLIDGSSAFCYQYTGDLGEIIVKADIIYMKSITIDVRDCYASLVSIYVSSDNINYMYVGEVNDDFGIFTLNVNKYVSYIKIESDRGSNSGDIIELRELDITGSQNRPQYTYDVSGNRVSRQFIITTKSAPGSEDQKPQEFRLSDDSNIILYPNPTSGVLHFEIKNTKDAENTEVKVRAYTVSGSFILEKEFNSSYFTVDLSGEQNGTYMLDINVNGEKKYFTIIKQ